MPEIKNMRLISHHDLNGFGNIGEGIHLHQTNDGRRVLYMAHESAPKDITGIDVSDLRNPKMLVQTDRNGPSHARAEGFALEFCSRAPADRQSAKFGHFQLSQSGPLFGHTSSCASSTWELSKQLS